MSTTDEPGNIIYGSMTSHPAVLQFKQC